MRIAGFTLRNVGPALAPGQALRKRRPFGIASKRASGHFAHLFVILAVLLAPVVLRAADTDVIQPRSSAQSPANTVGGNPAQPSWPIATALALCALAGGVFWYKRRAPGTTGSRIAKQLSIAESRPLGNRQHLVVADYAGQKFLLGVCPGRIDLLSKLEEPGTDTDDEL